jgi:hypothetical protein
MDLSLQFLPDAQPEDYPHVLKNLCIQRMHEFSNGVAQFFEGLGDQFNAVRVWFCPIGAFGTRVKRPMAEDPSPRDKLYSADDIMAFTFPLLEEVHDEPFVLFGPEAQLQERYVDEEVQGGRIALIALKQMRAQKPPNCLDRMQSTFSKQVAYNQRVLEAESQIAGINCDVPHFLEDMSVDEPVFVCINSSEEMKREEQAIAGQLWVQGDRQMTASNIAPEGMANTRDSALLYAAAEAVIWNHASQPDSPRKGQRVIIFPKDLPQLEEFLATSDANVDPEDGHPIAYEAILRESQKFETTPLFLREDCAVVTNDAMLAANVPEWFAKSRQVATGNRRRVLKDGDDVMSSSDEDDPNMKPDKEKGMYTPEMDPKAGPRILSQAEVMRQRMIAKANREAGFPDPPQSFRLSTDAQTFPLAAEVDKSVTRSRAVTDSTPALDDPKVGSSSREPADRPKGAKAPPPTKRQKVSKHPMSTRSNDGSRAGGFRPGVGGSGQKDTCVASSHPSQT